MCHAQRIGDSELCGDTQARDPSPETARQYRGASGYAATASLYVVLRDRLWMDEARRPILVLVLPASHVAGIVGNARAPSPPLSRAAKLRQSTAEARRFSVRVGANRPFRRDSAPKHCS